MAKKTAGPEIERLIQLLSRLPGLGPRSGRKAALALLKRRQELLVPLAQAMNNAADKLVECPNCGNIDTISPCTICQDPRRDPALIVVVEEIGDLWALERAGVVNARYHVLGGHLSPLDGVGPERLNIASLLTRAAAGEVKEVLLALNATVEGQSTAHYVMEQLETVGGDQPVAVSRLAQGVPIGGELDYLDEGTLAAAIKSRRRV
ncbi:MAG: recombination mediator RecR [Hyphomicrobiaceae bacterium]